MSVLATSSWAGTKTVTYSWEFSEGVWEGDPTYGYFAGHGAELSTKISHGFAHENNDNAGDLDYSADPDNPVFYPVDPNPIDPQFNRHILEFTESPLGDPAGAAYAVLAYVENLSDGDLVSFSFAGYINTAGGAQYVVPNAHYGISGVGPSPPGIEGPNDFLGGFTQQPQPLGGGGWVDLTFDGDLTGGGPDDPIVFNSADSFNPALATSLYLRARGVSPLDVLPAGSTDDDYNFYVDHLTVTVTSDNPLASITLPSLRTTLVNDADFDGDGDVDGGDFLVWQRGFGTTGNFDAADLSLWEAQYGSGATALSASASSSTGVPEPSTMVLAGLLLVTMIWRSRELSL